jgi:L-fuconolactonase
MIRVDAHHHLWTLQRGDYAWLTPDQGVLYRDFDFEMLRPWLDTARIDATILVQAAPTDGETEFLLSLARWRPRIAGVVGWTDLEAQDAAEKIALLAATPKLVGLRPMLQDLDDPAWILRPSVAPALAAMARHGLVLDALVKAPQWRAIVEAARRFPELPFVLDHAGKPPVGGGIDPDWRDMILTLGGCPNVTVKLSGLMTEGPPGMPAGALVPFVDILLEAFGPNRMLWGSDWPVLNQTSEYLSWVAVTGLLLGGLSSTEHAAIWGGTAARIYGIGAQ